MLPRLPGNWREWESQLHGGQQKLSALDTPSGSRSNLSSAPDKLHYLGVFLNLSASPFPRKMGDKPSTSGMGLLMEPNAMV